MDPISNFKSFAICTAKSWSYAMLIRIFSETFSCMPLVFVFFNSPKYIWPNSLKILVNCVFSLTRIFLQPFSILSTVYVLYIHGFFFISSISFLRIPWSLIITMWGALPLVLIDATRRTSQLVCRDHQRCLLFANACNFAGCIDK